MKTGIRELKDNLSRYIRRIEGGERVVAERVPPVAHRNRQTSRFEQLIASGLIAPPVDDGDPLENCPAINLPAGTANALIEQDRREG